MSDAPPQNLEAEENVLGAILISQAALDACSEILQPGDFYRSSHGTVYQAALDLSATGEPVDVVTLTAALERAGKLEESGGRVRLAEFAALVPATANVAHHARIIKDLAGKRDLIAAGQRIAQLGWENGDTTEALDSAQQIVLDLAEHRQHELEPISVALRDALEQAEQMAATPDGIVGTPTGFYDLDKLTAGFRNGQLVLLAARPKVGKSALALNIAAHLTLQRERPVTFFSMEMSRLELAQRLLAGVARVDVMRLQTGRLEPDEWSRLHEAGDKISRAPLYLDCSTDLTALSFRSRLRRARKQVGDVSLAIVDYLQLMVQGKAEHEVAEIGRVSRALKLSAMDLGVPVLALSQLNRSLEHRTDKRPQLSDLRGSGSLEQDADTVLFIHRTEADVELIVGANRSGPTGTVTLGWLPARTTFTNRIRDVNGMAA